MLSATIYENIFQVEFLTSTIFVRMEYKFKQCLHDMEANFLEFGGRIQDIFN